MKTVVITGGATGIGKQCARFFSKNGYLTIIFYNKSEKCAQMLKKEALENHRLIDIFKCDVTCSKSVERAFLEVLKKYTKIDALVNNAGVSLIKEFTKVSENEWDEVLNVNLKGAFLCSKQAVLAMLKSGGGRIINISSMWGVCGASFETVYSASKAGLIGFTKALAKELSGSFITVNAIAPGFIDTEMNSCIDECVKSKFKEQTPIGRLGTSEEIAKLVYYFATDAPDFVTGEVINANGGLFT